MVPFGREEIFGLCRERYLAEPDYPWKDSPEFAVLRHSSNKKWFALIMNLPKCRLGIHGDGCADFINLKCDPILIGSLRRQSGFFPAYHMNKEKWITIILDGTVPKNTICDLIDLSYDLTS